MDYIALQEMANNMKRVFTLVGFGLQILRWCGPRLFVSKMAHQLYGRTVFLVTTRPIDEPLPPSAFQCTTSLASPSDVDELFSKLYDESPEGRYELLGRKWYHERGFGDCYISRSADTNEICTVRWLVTPEHIKQLGWENGFPLSEDEIMLENVYTFEKYRREGARTASAVQVRKIAQQQGYKFTRGYNNEDSIPQRTWGIKASSKVSARVLERHFLFCITRKTLERFDPPIPITDLPDIE